jgi:hypothetical protein
MAQEAEELGEEQAYAILGLKPGATSAEIKRAYRHHARQTHPDTHPGDPHAAARFQRVHSAYSSLTGDSAEARRRIRRPRRRMSSGFSEARRAEELARTANVAVLRRAAKMPSALFAAAIARNPHCPPDLLEQLAAGGHWTIDLAIARRRDAPQSLLLALAQTHDHAVALALAGNPSCPPAALDLLAVRARWPDVRRAIAEHPACSPETLAVLARTSNVDTLVAVLNHAECPLEMRQRLTTHRASAVANAARSALAREGYTAYQRSATVRQPTGTGATPR